VKKTTQREGPTKYSSDTGKPENDLKKRDQELRSVYNIATELASDRDLPKILINSTGFLRQGMRIPDSAFASIHIDGVEYADRPLPEEEALTCISSEIVIEEKTRGSLRVCYRDGGAFLREEEELVREAANMVAKAIGRREMQAELRQYVGKMKEPDHRKSRRYVDLLDRAPVPIVIARLNGEIVKANTAFYRLLGYPADGSVKLNFVRDGLYENPEIRAVIYQNLLETGKLEGLELSLLDREGNSVPVLASYVFVDTDGGRYVESVYKNIRVRKDLENRLIEQNETLERAVRERTLDLENQKNLLVKKNQELLTMTEKIRTHRTRLQALFKAITDTVTVIDPDYNILMSNNHDIGNRGKCYKKVFGHNDRCPDCLMARVLEERSSVTQEKVVDDEYYLLQAYPIFNSDCVIDAVLETSRVITKEKHMERQLLQADKLASLGQLVSGIGHEINNPNTFIRGNLQIVQEAFNDIFPILDDYYRSRPELKIARLSYDVFRKNIPILVDDMVQGSNRIKGIVDGLRKFGKRDDGFLNEVVNLNAITESCLRLVDNQIRRTADVKADLDPDLPTIVGNSQKLQQVILNILINASQAIEQSRGMIKVSSRREDGEVIIRIKDNGKGMDEKTIGQIFDPFFTTKRNKGGTGLGLSIAYGIIKEHQGRIEVVSEVGAGTSFYIHLPLANG
jgi:PAS domain S-box-containing protein